MICYKASQHYVAVFWCQSTKRWTFFDDRLVEEKEDWLQVANFLLQDGRLGLVETENKRWDLTENNGAGQFLKIYPLVN